MAGSRVTGVSPPGSQPARMRVPSALKARSADGVGLVLSRCQPFYLKLKPRRRAHRGAPRAAGRRGGTDEPKVDGCASTRVSLGKGGALATVRIPLVGGSVERQGKPTPS